LDMPVMGEVQMNQKNTNCVGHNDLCKVVFPNNSETPKQDIEIYKTGDYKEPDYIEADNDSVLNNLRTANYLIVGKSHLKIKRYLN